jgi:hypothetical protein
MNGLFQEMLAFRKGGPIVITSATIETTDPY